MSELVDLRSDTVTRPTAGMRQAMAQAEVGDDVYAEDPTVTALQEELAARCGHEAALFVPSGSMGNQVALRLSASPGQELLCDTDAHVLTYELGAAAALGGISSRTVALRGAGPDPGELAAQLRPAGFGTVATAVVVVEQTHNRAGGAVYPWPALQEVRRVTAAAGVALHLDAARIFNAAVSSGLSVADYGRQADTLSVCLSKGLGAPVGSLVVGSAAAIAEARVLRKRLGGGMRQVGVLAAAGRYALAHHVERLAEDHRRAAELAAGLGLAAPETNIVVVDVLAGVDPAGVVRSAGAAGVLIAAAGPQRLRLVTHLDVTDTGIARAIEVLAPLLAPVLGATATGAPAGARPA